MKKVDKLQFKLMPLLPSLGYGFLMLIGSAIIMLSIQFYLDLKPFFIQEGGILGARSVVVSKKISAFDATDKSAIYFTEEQEKELQKQPFVEKISKFKTANFEVRGYMGGKGDVPQFSTDFFMEGIAQEYLDVQTDLWDWEVSDSLVPVIIPRSYLQLYNLGFAESKNLPVVSENMISQISFGLRVSGNGKSIKLKGRIIDFSDELNSILVPEDFIDWGNENYATVDQQRPNRLLITLSDADDASMATFFEDANYEVDQNTLKQNKVWFFLQSIFVFLCVVAVVIIILSCLAMFMGLNLMFHKNRDSFNNLALLGYTDGAMSRYILVISAGLVTLMATLAGVFTVYLRGILREEIISIYRLSLSHSIWIMTFMLVLALVLWNTIYIKISIKKVNAGLRIS